MREILGPGDPKSPQEPQQPQNETSTSVAVGSTDEGGQERKLFPDYIDPDDEWF